jgi:hypothetical protein
MSAVQCFAWNAAREKHHTSNKIKESDESYSKIIEARYYYARKNGALPNSHLQISKATCN